MFLRLCRVVVTKLRELRLNRRTELFVHHGGHVLDEYGEGADARRQLDDELQPVSFVCGAALGAVLGVWEARWCGNQNEVHVGVRAETLAVWSMRVSRARAYV